MHNKNERGKGRKHTNIRITTILDSREAKSNLIIRVTRYAEAKRTPYSCKNWQKPVKICSTKAGTLAEQPVFLFLYNLWRTWGGFDFGKPLSIKR